MLLTLQGEPPLLTASFEEGSLSHDLKVPTEALLWAERGNPQRLIAERQVQQLALEPAASFAIHQRLLGAVGNCHIVDASAVVDGTRMCKSLAELALMKQATAMMLQLHRRAAGLMPEGINASELGRFVGHAHHALGADGGSTFFIVQLGQATVYLHGIRGEHYLQLDQLVLIDTGCSVQGYPSDIIRTYIFGTPTAEQARIWLLHRRHSRPRSRRRCADIPGAARRVIAAAAAGLDRIANSPAYRIVPAMVAA